MLSQLAGRVVTGPLAFFVAFVIDLASYWVSGLRRKRGRTESGRRG